MLNFEQFQEYAVDHIRDFLPEELQSANVELNTVNKNNGKELHAILIRPEGSSIAPTVYLDGFFDSYQDGADLNSVMSDIAGTSAKHQKSEDFANIAQDYQDFEFVKDKIVMCIVNEAKNEKMLMDTPHIMHEDLAVIYKVMLNSDSDGIATITIKKPHVEAWGVSMGELHELAMENSRRLLPVTVKSMNEVLREMLVADGMPGEMAGMMEEDMPMEQQMYVITNSAAVNGAAGIVYSDALEQLSKQLGTDLFVLPSSIHEVIAVSADMGDAESLAEMVHEVNAGQVAIEEQLSDHVYRYDAKAQTLTLADTASAKEQEVLVSENLKPYDAQRTEAGRPRNHR